LGEFFVPASDRRIAKPCAAAAVLLSMNQDQVSGFARWQVWILIGALLFLLALWVSALVVPKLRLLHILQALIYIAVMILARRNSAWGLGVGIAVAVFWNSLQLVVTHNMQRGFVLFWSFLGTGQLRQLDTIMVALAWIGHCILIAGCLGAFFKQPTIGRNWWKLVGGGAIGLGYLALIVAIALPRR
jgi:hypothetical protein